jgi:hypothetical protein
VVASVLEIGFLYWDGLRTVHELARAAGLSVFGSSPEREDDRISLGLARAALELPNPPRGMYDIDPYREVSRARLVVVGILYKLKVGLTSFLIKAVLRRMMGRAALRAYLVLVSVPVTAVWNALVSYWVVREARIRVMGSSAASTFSSLILDGAGPISEAGQIEILRAVVGSIVRTHDLHPNLLSLYQALLSRLARPSNVDMGDTRTFLERLGELDPSEQAMVLKSLSVAAILDGKLARDERRLLLDARRVCGRSATLDGTEALRRCFLRGEEVTAPGLHELVWGPTGPSSMP